MVYTDIIIFGYVLDLPQLAMFLLVGVLIGMSKTGVSGANMIAVPILAIVFGGLKSSGLMLPILIMADFFGVSYYHRHAEYKYLWKLFPWAILGVMIGTYTGTHISDEVFRQIMGATIFTSLIVMVLLEKDKREKIPDFWWFTGFLGLLAGFTTMVGNLAGSIMALYLLSMRLPKNQFIGTAAWFFLGINLFKVPFHIWSWNSITVNSFLLDLILLPSVALGAFLGVKIVQKLPEKAFRGFIIIMTAVAAIFIMV
ncbi:sulfite exporter TauE/SafE family protein [Reichenbachiella versicolor]|uniref:sulfite exporter TauE/SafE family protein n=1 Tax=Reichenbachiella versicolor TaxID=1821036 RepID=UPI000D6E8245|nr:sulfite exporter TauE/SafE family protein [Reichenbachiella versicolor]